MIALPQMRGVLASSVGGGGGPADPFFAQVRLLCHFETDSPWTDEIGHTASVLAGAPALNSGSLQGAYAIDFDGTSDWLSFAKVATEFDFADSDDYTIEFSIRPTRAGASVEVYFDMSAGSPGVNSPIIYYNGAGNVIVFWNGADRIFTATGGAPNVNSWNNRIAFENSGGTKRLYFEGTPVASTAATLNITTGAIYLGRQSNGGAPYRGRMDELRITAAARYNGSTYTPATGPFPDH